MATNEFKKRILDSNRKFVVDDEFLDKYANVCGWKATIVYMSLCRHINKEQECFPSIKWLAAQHNVAKNTILAGIKILERWNIVAVKRSNGQHNNRYILLDKSVWNGSPEDCVHVGNQVISSHDTTPVHKTDDTCSGSEITPVHEVRTKDTHNKDTHKRFKEKEIYKEKENFEPGEVKAKSGAIRTGDDSYTPAALMGKFIRDKALQERVARNLQKKYGLDSDFSRQNLQRFIAYWTEPTPDGRKQRWELEKTFELSRRLVTWFNNSQKYSNQTNHSRVLRV